MQFSVIVFHPEYDNCAVPIIVEKVKTTISGVTEVRDRSRPYVFQEHRAQIPFKYFPLLIEQRGDEFTIEDIVPVDESALTDDEKKEYEKFKEQVKLAQKKIDTVKEEKEKDEQEQLCPYCSERYTGNRAWVSLIQHIRHSHEDNYDEWAKENKIGKYK